MLKTLFSASLLALAVAVPQAQAHQAGDIIVRAGAVTVDPREDSSHLKHATLGPLAGSKAELNSDTQLGLNFAYMLTDNWGIELLAATPFSHEVGAKIPVLGGFDGKLGDIKHLPPTLSAVYYPFPRAQVQPYVGVGINYTWFFDESLGSAAKAQGLHGLDLDNSVGWAAQIGFDAPLNDKLMLNAQIRYIDIETTGTTHLAADKVKVDVDVDPFVYMVGLGYKF